MEVGRKGRRCGFEVMVQVLLTATGSSFSCYILPKEKVAMLTSYIRRDLASGYLQLNETASCRSRAVEWRRGVGNVAFLNNLSLPLATSSYLVPSNASVSLRHAQAD